MSMSIHSGSGDCVLTIMLVPSPAPPPQGSFASLLCRCTLGLSDILGALQSTVTVKLLRLRFDCLRDDVTGDKKNY